VLCSWKFACLHLHIEQYEKDSEDCTVIPDFHDTNLPLKNILSVHGCAQDHLRALYPSWSGSIDEIVNEYFKRIGVQNECNNFHTVNNLHGNARRLALEADVKARVLDLVDGQMKPVGVLSKRGKPEAFDMQIEEETTPQGTVHEHEVYVPVSTPIFEARMLDKAEKNKLSQVEKSMQTFDELLESVDEAGFLKMSKTGADPNEKTRVRKGATVISMATHTSVVKTKDATILSLRDKISKLKRKVPDAPDPKTVVVVDLSSELDQSNKHCGHLLDKIQLMQGQLNAKQAKLDLASSEQNAAVANAKVEVMQAMMNGSFSTSQTPIRGPNIM
jgi:hypothetical protein